ncbi:MAG: ParA family protein [Prevotella sp.]|jgi:cellulose biosynthesis protein BcsQ|nr:ParA family protein [Prevotella sp.]
MKKEPLFISFSNQKGGVGKSAFTVLMASYFNYVLKKNVAIIDCDSPQHSVNEERERESKLIMNDPYYKKLALAQFKSDSRGVYPVVSSNTMDAITTARQLIESSDTEFDMIFFDLPGTLNTKGVLTLIANMDYVFPPMIADRLAVESTLQFSIAMNEGYLSVGKGNIKGMHLFWNMVDGREKTDIYDVYEKVTGELGLQLLKSYIPDTKKFRKDLLSSQKMIFRSTLFPADKTLIKLTKLDQLAEEISQIISQ